MRVLILGISGMLGRALADYISKHHPDVEIYGTVRDHHVRQMDLFGLPHCVTRVADLLDTKAISDAIMEIAPDWIFHLAAQSVVPLSYDFPEYTMRVNVEGSITVLETARVLQESIGKPVRVHFSSSSECYGEVAPNDVPIKETQPLRPCSPYGISKMAIDQLIEHYYTPLGMDVVRTRFFTMTGPWRGAIFAEGSFAAQIAHNECTGQAAALKVGNLESIRTFVDVRDAASALWLLMEKCPNGEVYNIGGRTTLKVGDMLERLLALSTTSQRYEVDKGLLRPTDVTLQIPDWNKFQRATGWEPEIPFEQTMEDLLGFYRQRYGVAGNYSTVISTAGATWNVPRTISGRITTSKYAMRSSTSC